MTTPVSAAASQNSAATNGSGQTQAKKPDTLANRDTFMKLLVAQLKYQNPLNPADGVQFLTQLAQFSSLEQNMQMAEDLGAIRKALVDQTSAGDGSGQNQTPSSGTKGI